MLEKPPTLPWYSFPSSKTGSTCRVYMMQAGGLAIPEDLALLPGPNQPSLPLVGEMEGQRRWFFVPDFSFLIEHAATGNKYVFDLGMRKDLEHSPPEVVKKTLPLYRNFPESLVDVLRIHGMEDQQPSSVKAVIFSHLHFDHIGDAGKHGFTNAELWIGPSTCSSARPGYPADEHSQVFSSDLPNDGTKKIVEFSLPSNMLDERRSLAIQHAIEEGAYEGIEMRKPASGWFGIGSFERCFDVFNDGSAYIIDAPGHMPGHQMVLVRVKINPDGVTDDFILLAGDCYHHPAMLRDPLRTARPPFYPVCMHGDPETAIETMFRAKRCAEEEYVWVIASHDFSIRHTIGPDTDALEGLVLLTDWRERGWKHQ